MNETTEPLDAVRIVVRRWKTVGTVGLVAFAIAVVYALLAPRWYEARLTVVPSQRSQNTIAMSIAAKLPEALDSFSTDVQRIAAVLTSNSVADAVIDKFKLGERYDERHRERIRATLWKHCNTAVDRKSNLVSLTCEDKDPKVAMEMTAFFGEVGNKVFGRVTGSAAKEESLFLEGQVAKAKADVDDASKKLREFQTKYKIVDLPEQSKAVISAMASMQGELLSKQLELSYLTRFSSRTEPSVIQLQQQIGIMQDKLNQLEAISPHAAAASDGAKAGSAPPDFFPSPMNVPALRYELEQLMRQQKITETVFFLMTQRYEMAKADAARDTSTFQILDFPTLPTFKSRPVTWKFGALGLFVGLFIGIAVTLLPAWWRRAAGS